MLKVGDHRELQAAALAMKAADRDLKRRINAATREKMNPVWKDLVKANLFGDYQMAGKVLNGGVRIAAGNPPRALAAQSTRNVGSRPNKGGKSKTGPIVPSKHYYAWEFGVNRMNFTRYERKNRSRPGYHVVNRRTTMGHPRREPKGRVVYPAFADIAPRMTSLWVQIVVKSYHDAAEGKG